MASPMITPVTDDTSATNAAPPSPQQNAAPAPTQAPAQQPTQNAAPAPTQAPPPPPQPGSLWKNMLVGAMQGIAGAKGTTSFGGGVAGGAANVIAQKQQAFENQQTQQQNTSINNFRDVQSAHLVAQTAAEAAQLQHMPEEYQQQRDDHAQKMAEANQKNGWATYTPISLKSGPAAMTYLNSQPDGASMPPGTITGATVAYVPSANSDAGSAFEQYKTLGPAFGMAALDRGSFLRMKPEQQAQQVRMLTNIANGRKMDGSVYKPNELPQAISQMTDLATKAKAAGNDAAAQAVSSTLGELQNQLNASNKQSDTTADKKLGRSQILKATPGAGGTGIDKDAKTFKTNLDSLAKTEQSYTQFQDVLKDINAGKDITGAQSVTSLFNAIGLSATPLKGMGFRINNNTVAEHENARGLGEGLYQKFLRLKSGDVVTPQQIKDYANIASQARANAYVTTYNEVANAGSKDPSFVLPRGNGQALDANTGSIFLKIAGGDANAARALATKKGWKF